jgi:hypothetical protein
MRAAFLALGEPGDEMLAIVVRDGKMHIMHNVDRWERLVEIERNVVLSTAQQIAVQKESKIAAEQNVLEKMIDGLRKRQGDKH